MLKYLCLAALLIAPQLAHAGEGFGFRARLRGDYAAGGCTSAQASACPVQTVRERHVVHHRSFRAGSGCNGYQASAGGCTGFQAGYQSSGCNGRQGGGYQASVTIAGPIPAQMPEGRRSVGGAKSYYSTNPSELAQQLLDEHAAANPGRRASLGGNIMGVVTELISFLQLQGVTLPNIIAEVQKIIAIIHGTPLPPAPVPIPAPAP